ncbi:alpha/beta fold hydrolase [Halobacillus locisalis]|nr:alpha/beta hydrolase [Halobacillus locisalis]
MNIMRKQAALSNGETLSYQERDGGEEVVVLIHGNMTSSVHWDIVLEGLSDEYKVYAPDLRGFGLSTYHEKVLSIEDFADDIKLFLDEVGVEECMLVGWSLGGAVGQQLCVKYPDRCKALYLMASASTRGYPIYKTGEDGLPDVTHRLNELEEVEQDARAVMINGAYQSNNYEALRQIWNMLIYVHNKPEEDRYEKYLEDMTTQRNLAETYHALNHHDVSSEVQKLDIPVWISWGADDLVVTKEMTEELRSDLGEQATYEEFDICGHSPLIDVPDRLISSLESFFGSVNRLSKGGSV